MYTDKLRKRGKREYRHERKRERKRAITKTNQSEKRKKGHDNDDDEQKHIRQPMNGGETRSFFSLLDENRSFNIIIIFLF